MTWNRAAALLVWVVLGCGTGSTGAPDLDTGAELGEGTRVLFVGNSYLYTMDIPGIVQAMADSAGREKLAVATVAGPDMALVDHWNDGSAVRRIRSGGWKWVVLQQGPSSTDINRDSLRLTTGWFAGEVRGASGVPALFSAWPTAARRQDFPRAIDSYRLAAQDVSGQFLPVASAWLDAWERDPTIELYADGLHPSAAGAYLAALVVYGRLRAPRRSAFRRDCDSGAAGRSRFRMPWRRCCKWPRRTRWRRHNRSSSTCAGLRMTPSATPLIVQASRASIPY